MPALDGVSVVVPKWVYRRFEESYPNGRFLIGKWTLGMVPVNDHFWPKAAVALKPSRMSELGQQRTSGAMPIYVRCWVYSGRTFPPSHPRYERKTPPQWTGL